MRALGVLFAAAAAGACFPGARLAGTTASGAGGASAASSNATSGGDGVTTGGMVSSGMVSSGMVSTGACPGGAGGSPPQCANYVFVSKTKLVGDQILNGGSQNGNGNMPPPADAVCNDEAKCGVGAVAKKMRWVAIYSTSKVAAPKHVTAQFNIMGNVCLPDGSIVASSDTTWWSQMHTAAINQHADGSPTPVEGEPVWTATGDGGWSSQNNCHDWTSRSPSDYADVGSTAEKSNWALSGQPATCDNAFAVYCLSNPM